VPQLESCDGLSSGYTSSQAPIPEGKAGKTLSKNKKKYKKALDESNPGALWRKKDRLMCRDRQGKYALCEVLEIRKNWIEPTAEFDTEESKQDDPFAF
jgi:hypothetical protein